MIFYAFQLWNTYHSPESVIKMCRKSVENIGLGYLDLFLIHWPVAYVASIITNSYAIMIFFELY